MISTLESPLLGLLNSMAGGVCWTPRSASEAYGTLILHHPNRWLLRSFSKVTRPHHNVIGFEILHLDILSWWRLTSKASGPHYDAYHVDVIGFDISHFDIASWWRLTSKVGLWSQWTQPQCLPCCHHWFSCVTLGYCIMMVADLQSQPPRPVDPIMMLTMLTSLVLMCHQVVHDVPLNIPGNHWHNGI